MTWGHLFFAALLVCRLYQPTAVLAAPGLTFEAADHTLIEGA